MTENTIESCHKQGHSLKNMRFVVGEAGHLIMTRKRLLYAIALLNMGVFRHIFYFYLYGKVRDL